VSTSEDEEAAAAVREAARLLLELVAGPRQGIIWPKYHGAWSGNVEDAFERGAQALLSARGDVGGADSLRRLKDDPGDAVATVLKTGGWPEDVRLAMLRAAEVLTFQVPSPIPFMWG
jgi:hypothetical protein